MIRKSVVFGALVLALCAGEAQGGILITKKGKTFVGRIDGKETPPCPENPEDIPEVVTLTWPYKDSVDGPYGRAKWEFRSFEIRWYSVDADQPTDEYWEKFLEEEIDVKWHRLRDEFKRGLNREETGGFDPIKPKIDLSSESNRVLSPHAQRFGKAKVQYPDGWNVRNVGNVFIIERPDPGTGGFRPKIHLFEVGNVPALVPETVDMVRNTLDKQLEGVPESKFEVLERSQPNAIASVGFDVNLSTASTVGERRVRTLRRIAFRTEQTYFFAAYAHEEDWSELESLFKKCRNTLEVEE
ncbi:MAG: hypothetical protein R3F62_11155 [Planctomycetota bacterium]